MNATIRKRSKAGPSTHTLAFPSQSRFPIITVLGRHKGIRRTNSSDLHCFRMLSRVFSKSQSLVRGFSKVSTAHTKYNVLTIPCLKDSFSFFRHSILISRLYCVDYGQQELCRRGSFKSCVCGRCGAELRVQPEGNSGDAPSHVEPTRCIKRRKHVVGLGEVLNKHPELPVYAGEFADVGGSFLSGGRRATRKWSERSATATRSL